LAIASISARSKARATRSHKRCATVDTQKDHTAQENQEDAMTRAAMGAVRGAAMTAAAILTAVPPGGPLQAADITEAEAQAIGVDAYLYFYPLITMDVTRRQLTNMELGKSEIGGPANVFVNVQTFPTADMRAVVRPNFDTLYSSAWLDLAKEPMVISVPDTGGRYYLLPMLDMWTDVFASPGWRTTGTTAANYLVTPPGWRGDGVTVPENMQRIDAPTPYVWIIGRTKTDGPPDYDAVHKIQEGYKITPLSQWGKEPTVPTVTIDPSVDMKTPPKVQVDTMPADKYFAYAAELLKLQPAHITDEPIIARMKRIGIEPGKAFDLGAAGPAIASGLQGAPEAAQKLMQWKTPTLARVENHWSMNTDTMGVYGNYYLKRAMVAQLGLGANLPEDAVYPLNLGDAAGKPLYGTANYTLHFAKGELPPASAFWSVTLYDNDGFQVGNALNRFALSSWMPFQANADGSLDLYFQNASPGADKEANWLPAPKGPFTLTMRIYAPKSDVLTGVWNPPPVQRAE
jgi:hypothetical protein